MEIFSKEQSEYMADKTACERTLWEAQRDGYCIEIEHKGFFLILNIDEDKEEGLKKNFYKIIGPKGEKYQYNGCTYRIMELEEFKLIVQEIQAGTRKPYDTGMTQ